MLLFHYTDDDGYKAIGSQRVWTFRAQLPPGGRPYGAYFTTLDPFTPKLAKRLRIPVRKLEYAFCFRGAEGLVRYDGGRGAYLLYSPTDYPVGPDRQVAAGPTEAVAEGLK